MTITFLTNFINHHQVPLADAISEIIGADYKMVTFEPIPEEFLKRGYADYSDRLYHVKGYLKENKEFINNLIINSDIVLHGAAPEIWVKKRMELLKPTIRYEERLFKKIDRRLIQLHYWKQLFAKHTRYRKAPLYMLGASAYNRLDTAIIMSYPNKVYRWGYFTYVPNLEINDVIDKKPKDKIYILWCGTIAQVKRPDLVPILALQLKNLGYDFVINMIGTGGLESHIRHQIHNLGVDDYVHMLGNIPNEEVLQAMRRHHIFIFTSNYGEGWGAVINEAMSNGCAVVSSNKVGAAPFLIKPGYNGFMFNSGNSSDLLNKVTILMNDENLRNRCILNAYTSMVSTWSPKVAAKNFIKFCSHILNSADCNISDGPCSKAKLIL